MAAKARYRVAWQSPNSRRADASEANGLRNLKCRNPLKSILFAALMNFGSRRESLTAEIRNFIIRQNRNCNKQRNSHPQNSRVSTPSTASVRLRNLGRQRFTIAIRNVIHLLGFQLHPFPNPSEARHVSSRQEAHVHRPRGRTGPAFWKYAP